TWEMKVGDSAAYALFLLDGMGGGQAGEDASEQAAVFAVHHIKNTLGEEHMMDTGTRHHLLLESIANADTGVRDLAKKIGGGARCGSTLVVYLVIDGPVGRTCDLAWIGDSRAYTLSDDGSATLLSNDHSTTGEMVDAGYIELWEISKTPGHNVLSRSLGSPEDEWKGGEAVTVELDDVDALLLCCDGVWGPLHGKNGLVLPEGGDVLDAEAWVEAALAAESTDNCSALVVRLDALRAAG
ncbi:MAG TPA: PP2C family protein-serine/threonine phosphatase, partial [Candidatus Poseidoniales archaeon]|nr:PP2C family protein-serine/threonine phosphatase [Candidatus Poseidoniales archaeon]